MPATSSFLGKCITVLIGMALSWATLTNARFSDAVGALLGDMASKSSEDASLGVFPPVIEGSGLAVSHMTDPIAIPSPAAQVDAAVVTSANTDTTVSVQTDEQRILAVSNELKELGATYLRMEKLTGDDGTWYRVRCDLAGEPTPVKCSLEATRQSAVEAIEVIATAVRNGFQSPKQLAELH